MHLDRYTISAVPAFLLIFALCLNFTRNIIQQYITIVSLAILLIPGLYHCYNMPLHSQYKEAVHNLQGNTNVNDLIIMLDWSSNGKINNHFNWYYNGNANRCTVKRILNEIPIIEKQIEKSVCLIKEKFGCSYS